MNEDDEVPDLLAVYMSKIIETICICTIGNIWFSLKYNKWEYLFKLYVGIKCPFTPELSA